MIAYPSGHKPDFYDLESGNEDYRFTRGRILRHASSSMPICRVRRFSTLGEQLVSIDVWGPMDLRHVSIRPGQKPS